MVLHSLTTLFSLLLGLSLGSFMNVCIYRIPLRRSIISPPSACPRCGARIRFYDNIPLLSYLLLRGKCRHCGASIGWRYPLVEGLAGLLSLALFIRYGLSYQYILTLLFASALVTVSFIDLDHRIIPDLISLPGVVAGWGASLLPGGTLWLDSLIGTVAGGGTLFLVAFVYERLTGREGMGGGDIKLLAMIGAWMGWRPLPIIVLISSLTGAIIGALFIVLAGKGYRFRIPFGPFLSLGALFYLFFGAGFSRWYFSLFLG
ncbi:MAG TPA: prepilin peptidase [Deltaproteobacteria bacterium]|nr:prepilin peptidase [Deltaproteobacteria bacterium]